MAHRKNRTEHTNAQTQGVIAEVRGAEQKVGTTGNRYLLRITTTGMVLRAQVQEHKYSKRCFVSLSARNLDFFVSENL